MLPMIDEFYRIQRLPPYVFAEVNAMKAAARARGEDIVDLGMGNPDGAPPKMSSPSLPKWPPSPTRTAIPPAAAFLASERPRRLITSGASE
jgi:hypothetical protein